MNKKDFLRMITNDFVTKGTHEITGATAMAGNICKMFPAEEYTIDVLMDRFGHKSRTMLADADFNGNLFDTLEYAMNNSSATTYSVVKTPTKRNDQFVNRITIIFN